MTREEGREWLTFLLFWSDCICARISTEVPATTPVAAVSTMRWRTERPGWNEERDGREEKAGNTHVGDCPVVVHCKNGRRWNVFDRRDEKMPCERKRKEKCGEEKDVSEIVKDCLEE